MKSNSERIRKPMNSFFYYRKAMRPKIIAMHQTLKSNDISKIAADWWKMESKEVKDYYRNVSKTAHAEHKMKYPSFDWQPWKSKPKNSKKVKSDKKECLKVNTSSFLSQNLMSSSSFISPDVLMSATMNLPQPNFNVTQFTSYPQSPKSFSQLSDISEFSLDDFCNTDFQIPYYPPSPIATPIASPQPLFYTDLPISDLPFMNLPLTPF